MGKQPAVIIIARHGSRLDAADKSWHLSSPTPYDPPLTYGGFNQSRTLGLRIASLLQAREESATGEIPVEPHELTTANGGHDSIAPEVKPPSRKRKHKVFVHSSPFQRCVQTGIGISAGISQYQGIVAGRAQSESRPRSSREFQPSPRLHAVDATAASVAARSNLLKSLKDQPKQSKTTLRIDACLGEWLSPDYFDLITPPPNSTMMVAGAKADLLRRGEELNSYSYAVSPTLSVPNKGGQGNLWSSGRAPDPTSAPHVADGPLDMKSLSQTLPGRDRTMSYSSGRVSPFGRPVMQRSISSEILNSVGYTPPTPNYAVSPVEPIPRGYVAHARDACVDVDYQWDSMRAPLLWGDGGDYGEEWSAMHKRFRKGLNHLIDWYGEHGSSGLPDEHEAVPGVDGDHDTHDAEEEIVVVLVTHGAGCNALIGALTEQPVLIDVGMASLTMAVRKDKPVNGHGDHHDSVIPQFGSPTSSPKTDRIARRNGSISTGLSQKYDMKIVASSEHLRPGYDATRPTTPTPSSPSLAASKTVPESRRRSTLLSHAAAGSPLEPTWTISEQGPRPSNMSTALGSIRRLSTQNVGPPQRSGSVSSVASATGLWMPSTPPLPEHRRDKEPPAERKQSPDRDPLDLSGAPADNKLGISYVPDTKLGAPLTPTRSKTEDPTTIPRISMTSDTPSRELRDSVSELPQVSQQVPANLGRKLSQKGLWGSAPSGNYERDRTPKRRWTLQQD
ncbi:hypothetical protein C1H76_2949 [Elsinoe australis]|uniref:Phosphoglycerate mutase family protein n=1 Tax=Elsinoe australis TaxID=40998 RepID=A0A4U7B987_9PEZI|nr:hypothetical protein C1H76_2949 [Elsinoe australis]